MKQQRTYRITVRFNLGSDADARALAYLREYAEQNHKSNSQVVIAALNARKDIALDREEFQNTMRRTLEITMQDFMPQALTVGLESLLARLQEKNASSETESRNKRHTRGGGGIPNDAAMDFVAGL